MPTTPACGATLSQPDSTRSWRGESGWPPLSPLNLPRDPLADPPSLVGPAASPSLLCVAARSIDSARGRATLRSAMARDPNKWRRSRLLTLFYAQESQHFIFCAGKC